MEDNSKKSPALTFRATFHLSHSLHFTSSSPTMSSNLKHFSIKYAEKAVSHCRNKECAAAQFHEGDMRIGVSHHSKGKEVTDGYAHPQCLVAAFPDAKFVAAKVKGYEKISEHDQKLLQRVEAGDIAHLPHMTMRRSKSPSAAHAQERAKSPAAASAAPGGKGKHANEA